MNQAAGWHRLAKGGLLCVAVILGSLIVIDQLRDDSSPRYKGPAPLGPPPPPQGPPMQIAAKDLASAGRLRNDNSLEMPFCWCPPGSFHMGNSSGDSGGSLTPSAVGVTISQGFWMGKFEVTQAQWKRVMGLTLREQRAKDPEQPRPVGDNTMRDHVGEGPDYPIYFMNYTEAEEFCRRLTAEERKANRLEAGWEYRLPTEAEWEFACRAGTTTATAFGDKMSSLEANFDGSKPFNDAPAGPYLKETTPVGHYPANRWGIHDMHGNVWEWCRDGHKERLVGGTDPLQETSSTQRTYRGGGWHNPVSLCVSATRGSGDVSDSGSSLGLRVALVSTRH